MIPMDLVALFVSLAGLVTALAALRDKPPVKWIIDRLVAQPLEEALDRLIGERIEPTAKKVSLLYAEMHPNGGSSLRDAVNRTETKVSSVDGKIERVDDKVGQLDTRVGRVEGAVDVLSRRP